MGYKTFYSLNVSSAPDTGPIFDDTYKQLEDAIDAIIRFDDGSLQDTLYIFAKWYDYEKDMVALSARFPEVLFTLHGKGEDSEDLWYAYFLNGKVQHCPAQIIYDDFDPTKMVSGLKEVTTHI